VLLFYTTALWSEELKELECKQGHILESLVVLVLVFFIVVAGFFIVIVVYWWLVLAVCLGEGVKNHTLYNQFFVAQW